MPSYAFVASRLQFLAWVDPSLLSSVNWPIGSIIFLETNKGLILFLTSLSRILSLFHPFNKELFLCMCQIRNEHPALFEDWNCSPASWWPHTSRGGRASSVNLGAMVNWPWRTESVMARARSAYYHKTAHSNLENGRLNMWHHVPLKGVVKLHPGRWESTDGWWW